MLKKIVVVDQLFGLLVLLFDACANIECLLVVHPGCLSVVLNIVKNSAKEALLTKMVVKVTRRLH